MERIVLKLDCIALADGERSADAIEDILDACGDPLVAVVPAFEGVAAVLDRIDSGAICPSPEAAVSFLREGHLAIAEAMDAPAAALSAASLRIEVLLRRLGALLSAHGKIEGEEALAIGARLSATCVALAFAALGRPAPIVEPEPAGPRIRSALDRFACAVVPGAYGVDTAAIASALGARLRDAEGALAYGRARLPFAPASRGGVARSRIAQKPGVA